MMRLIFPATLSKICFFLLLSNIFTACPQQKKDYKVAEAKIELGTYHLQPMTGAGSKALQDLAPEYRLVSAQDSGYLVSTDTGLSYVVDGAGKVTQLDKSNIPINKHTRVFAAADDAVWLVTAERLRHSKGQDGLALVGDKARVLWFSRLQILLWGGYQHLDGSIKNGLQLYSLDSSSRVKKTTTVNEELIKKEVPTFIGAEKFIAGGLSQLVFWLWTREGGLLLLREKASNKKELLFEERAKISFPHIAGKVFKDIGFIIQITIEGDIPPPEYVLGIAAGDGNRGALHIATKTP